MQTVSISILNPNFRYTPAMHTNLHEAFERIRREQDMQKPPLVLPCSSEQTALVLN
ncbi:hypothetical protein [Glaciimonas soli]|uniref:hypothetical protein n=1 Tax=Glaciimonas soli TaxID=2590999 RepID=UPI0012935949|nr:hypothetical protein [Glaciimonas soli]